VGDAAKALDVSVDTLRRWGRDGRIRLDRDERNRRIVPESEIRRLRRRVPATSGTAFSARNRFEGVVTAVEITGVIALVELQAGPHHIVSIITRDAVEELGLAPGVLATATVKATSVMIDASAPDPAPSPTSQANRSRARRRG
jgi:molybdopterin-binding protein